MTKSKRPTFEQACAQYVHRYTCDYVPRWARVPVEGKGYYAPQFRSDREWYDNTLFPGEPEHPGGRKYCYTRNHTWPLGQWLTLPYSRAGTYQ